MGTPLAPLITEAADVAFDVARAAHAGEPLDGAVKALEEKREDLQGKKLLVEAQIAEIERFHQQVTGRSMKKAAIRALTWHL